MMTVSYRFLALIAAVALTVTTFVLPAYAGPVPAPQSFVAGPGR